MNTRFRTSTTLCVFAAILIAALLSGWHILSAEAQDHSEPPGITGITADKHLVTITYDRALRSTFKPDPKAFTVYLDSTSVQPHMTAFGSNMQVRLTLDRPYAESIHTVRVSYNADNDSPVVDIDGDLGRSVNRMSATNDTEESSVPGSPISLRGTTHGSNAVYLTWKAPSNDGSSPITGYRVEVAKNSTDFTTLVANTRSMDTHYVHTGLSRGNTRYYRVRALNRVVTDDNQGSTSNSVRVSTHDTPAATITSRALPAAVNGSSRFPQYEVSITFPDSMRTVDGKFSHRAVQSYVKNAHVTGSRMDPTAPGGAYQTWKITLRARSPGPVNADSTIEVNIPKGVFKRYYWNTLSERIPVHKIMARNVPGSDNKSPKVTLVDETLGGAQFFHPGPYDVTVSFNETVTGFRQNDVRVSGGTLKTFTMKRIGREYKLNILPNAQSNAEDATTQTTVSIGAGAVTDQNGNRNTAGSYQIGSRPRPLAKFSGGGHGSTIQKAAFNVTLQFKQPRLFKNAPNKYRDMGDTITQSDVRVQGTSKCGTHADAENVGAGSVSVENFTSSNSNGKFTINLAPTKTGCVKLTIPSGAGRDEYGYPNLPDEHWVRVSMEDETSSSDDNEDEPPTPTPNNKAKGRPHITGGDYNVGNTLTASVSVATTDPGSNIPPNGGIYDADGLTDPVFRYQWLRNNQPISGATGTSYTLRAADANWKVRTRVTFTDDAGNAEQVSTNGSRVEDRSPDPFTATISLTPSTYQTNNPKRNYFKFKYDFSEDPKDGFSYKTLRDYGFTVTNGTVWTAKRTISGNDDAWWITIVPTQSANGSWPTVTVRAKGSVECDQTGAICAPNPDRKLRPGSSFSVRPQR